jgi:4-diphosphocytidyl-2-C-methyl-D-erythritol kinase
MRVTVNAPAKINLTLEILGKRDDGYHLVKMLMQSVSLSDTVQVWENGEANISVICGGDVPQMQDNIAYKAVEAFFQYVNLPPTGVSVKIKKEIPVSAGLAGGSADAAAVLVALNRLTEKELPLEELCEIGAKVGADVPFCILGGTMTAEGTGTILTPVPDLPDCTIILCKPPIAVSTKEAYALTDAHHLWGADRTDRCVEAVCTGEITQVAAALYNEFEGVLRLPAIDSIKATMIRFGALGSCMSGSGPTVFGIFEDKSQAEDCLHELRLTYDEVFLAHPVYEGCRVEE